MQQQATKSASDNQSTPDGSGNQATRNDSSVVIHPNKFQGDEIGNGSLHTPCTADQSESDVMSPCRLEVLGNRTFGCSTAKPY